MSAYGAFISGFVTKDYHTETAGTAIDEQIPGSNGVRLALLFYSVVTSTTAHTLALLEPSTSTGSNNTTSAAAAASQKVINVTNTPLDPAGNAAAASDIVAYQCTDGSWEFNTIASVATKAITHSTNLAKAVGSGAHYVIFGVVGDGVGPRFALAASTTNNTPAVPLVAVHKYMSLPWYLTIDNATAVSKLYTALFAYINK